MAKKRKTDSAKIISIIIIVLALLKVYVWPNLDIQAVLTALDVQQDEIVSQIQEENVEKHDEPVVIPNQPSATSNDGLLKIHYIDVGQADCALITLDGNTMLIDAGDENSDGPVMKYLMSQNIVDFDYVIASHPHADHIGEMDSVVNTYKIDTLLMPKATHTAPSFISLTKAMKAKNLRATNPKIGDTYKFGDAEFTILNTVDSNPEELNNASIVIRLVYGDQSFMFTGDAEKDVEYQMMDSGMTLKSNVLKVGHHGSQSSSLEKFIKAVDPDIAIISVGADNSYGHPHDKIVNRLNRLNIKTYRTDKHGTIIISSDGKNSYVSTEKEE